MIKLYTDCESDAERAEYFRDGSAWEGGIIAQEIQSDVADAFQFRAQVAAALEELRAEMQARMRRPPSFEPEIEVTVKSSARHWLQRLDAVITKLGLALATAQALRP